MMNAEAFSLTARRGLQSRLRIGKTKPRMFPLT